MRRPRKPVGVPRCIAGCLLLLALCQGAPAASPTQDDFSSDRSARLSFSNACAGSTIGAATLPALKTAPPPRYPRAALARGIEGFVEVEFCINEAGKVVDVRVLSASPNGVFEQAVEQALGKRRYASGPARVRQRFRFQRG